MASFKTTATAGRPAGPSSPPALGLFDLCAGSAGKSGGVGTQVVQHARAVTTGLHPAAVEVQAGTVGVAYDE